VSRVDLDGRKIDFRLVREGEEFMARALKDKGVAPAGRAEGAPAKTSAKRAAKKAAGKSKAEGVKPAGKKVAAKAKTARKPRR
jgi:ribonuclease R